MILILVLLSMGTILVGCISPATPDQNAQHPVIVDQIMKTVPQNAMDISILDIESMRVELGANFDGDELNGYQDLENLLIPRLCHYYFTSTIERTSVSSISPRRSF